MSKERNDELFFGADIKDNAKREGEKSKKQERDDEVYFGARVLEKEDEVLSEEEQERADEVQYGAKVKKQAQKPAKIAFAGFFYSLFFALDPLSFKRTTHAPR